MSSAVAPRYYAVTFWDCKESKMDRCELYAYTAEDAVFQSRLDWNRTGDGSRILRSVEPAFVPKVED